MASFYVACPACGTQLKIEDRQRGHLVRCSGCGRVLRIPGASPDPEPQVLPPPPPPSESGTKKCPYCAEQIRLEAIKCRFCGELIEGRPSPPFGQWSRSRFIRTGAIVLALSLIGFVYFATMGTTVEVTGLRGGPERFHNVGLMHRRQTGMTASIGGVISGLLLIYIGRRT